MTFNKSLVIADRVVRDLNTLKNLPETCSYFWPV
jgi:hypothetical protein